MSENKKRPFLRLPIAALSLALLIAVTYLAAMLNDFEYTIGHFENGSVPFILCAVFTALAVCLLIVTAAAANRRTVYEDFPAPSPLGLFGASLGALLAFALAALALVHAKSMLSAVMSPEMVGIPPEKLRFWSALLGLCLCASLILPFFEKYRRHPLTGILACLGALSVNLEMFAVYFDFSIPLNSPVRNFTVLAEASVLLFLVSEARLALAKKPAKLAPAYQLFASAAAASLGLGVALGAAVYRLAALGMDPVPSPEPNLSLLRLAMYIGIGVLAADRLIASSKLVRTMTPEEIAEAKRLEKEEKEKKKKNKTEEKS